MTDETYVYFWKQFEKTIAHIENKFSDENKEKWHFRRVHAEEYREVIKAEYVSIRDNLKKRCYKVEHGNGDINRIDQHKIAACFCYAFLRHKAFSFKLDDEIPYEMLLSNYMVAYSISLQVIYLCLIDLYLSFKDPQKQALAFDLKRRGTLLTPDTTTTHDSYNLGRVKTLALNEYHKVSFDLLAYADMMYWIEHYNRQCLERSHVVRAIDPNKDFQD